PSPGSLAPPPFFPPAGPLAPGGPGFRPLPVGGARRGRAARQRRRPAGPGAPVGVSGTPVSRADPPRDSSGGGRRRTRAAPPARLESALVRIVVAASCGAGLSGPGRLGNVDPEARHGRPPGPALESGLRQPVLPSRSLEPVGVPRAASNGLSRDAGASRLRALRPGSALHLHRQYEAGLPMAAVSSELHLPLPVRRWNGRGSPALQKRRRSIRQALLFGSRRRLRGVRR